MEQKGSKGKERRGRVRWSQEGKGKEKMGKHQTPVDQLSTDNKFSSFQMTIVQVSF